MTVMIYDFIFVHFIIIQTLYFINNKCGIKFYILKNINHNTQ